MELLLRRIASFLLLLQHCFCVVLECYDTDSTRELAPGFTVQSFKISKFGFRPGCPCPYDRTEKCRNAPHMCVASNVTHACSFKMKDMILHKNGMIAQEQGLKPIVFSHKTISGGTPPVYFPGDFTTFANGYTLKPSDRGFLQNPTYSGSYDLVIPARMKFDDCFNHMCHQLAPFVGSVFEFHADIIPHATWHGSHFTAAFLNMLDIPLEKIVVAESIKAKEVVLPWMANWCPLQLSAVNGIANKVLKRVTRNLISRKFDLEGNRSLKPLRVAGSGNATLLANDPSSDVRYIILMSRGDEPREVLNERAIVAALEKHLRGKYKLLVLGHTIEYKAVELLQRSWQRFAAIVSKARVIIGPHGAALGNLMWSPDDCDVIEFNEFPDKDHFTQNTGQTPVRPTLIAAHWAKGGTGHYWLIEAARRSPKNFYFGKMRVSIREILEVLKKIGDGIVDPHLDLSQYPEEPHGFWEERENNNLPPRPSFATVPLIMDNGRFLALEEQEALAIEEAVTRKPKKGGPLGPHQAHPHGRGSKSAKKSLQVGKA